MLRGSVQKSTKLGHGASKGWKGHNEDRAVAPVFGASAPRAGPRAYYQIINTGFIKKRFRLCVCVSVCLTVII